MASWTDDHGIGGTIMSNSYEGGIDRQPVWVCEAYLHGPGELHLHGLDWQAEQAAGQAEVLAGRAEPGCPAHGHGEGDADVLHHFVSHAGSLAVGEGLEVPRALEVQGVGVAAAVVVVVAAFIGLAKEKKNIFKFVPRHQFNNCIAAENKI